MAHTPSTAGAGPRREGCSGAPERRSRCGSFLILSAAPIGGHAGVRPHALALRAAPEGGRYVLALLDQDHRTLMVLGSYLEEDAVAAWRRLGLAAGLPLAIEGPDGTVHLPYPQIGRVLLDAIRERRRGLLTGRRPRFLTRRKTGRFPRRPRVHREPEIVGGREV